MASPFGFRLLDLGKDALDETVSEALDRPFDPANIRDIRAYSDDHDVNSLKLSSRIPLTSRKPAAGQLGNQDSAADAGGDVVANQIALGEKFYLFTANGFDRETDHLIISAHGGYWNLFGPLGSSSIPVPDWTRLHFYAAHGSTISDPEIYPLMRGDYQVSETVSPGSRVTDYTLSKYQGRHGNRNETYTSIDRHIDRNIDHLSYIAEQAALGVSSQRNFGFRFHVLTVRNRWFQFSPTLSEALATLDRGGWRYENIHCSFCRNPMLSFSPPSANATPFGA